MPQCPSVSAGISAATPPKPSSDHQTTAIATARPRRGRKGAKASSVGAGPWPLMASQAARRDVRDEDRSGPEVVELVHESVPPPAWHHRADRNPGLVLHGRDCRRLEPGRQLGGPVDELLGAVVVEHDVGAGGDDAGDTALEHLYGLRLALPVAADQHGLRVQDRLTEDLETLL